MPTKADNTGDAASVIAEEQHSDNPKISPERVDRWATLLGRRPATKEGDMMSAWLMEVLAVSDLDTPLKPSEELNVNPKEAESKENAAAADLGAAAAKAGAAVSPVRDSKKITKETPGSAVVKKKRPSDSIQGDVTTSSVGNSATDAEMFASGSFAAWKERKKQKSQAKTNATQEAEV